MTGYAPLDTLKPVTEGLWIIDGPSVTASGVSLPTRATVVKLQNGELWVHSPTRLTDALQAELEALGQVRHLVIPNTKQNTFVEGWQEAFPKAQTWAAPGVADRAAEHDVAIKINHDLRVDQAEAPWVGQMEQMVVRGSTTHREAVFFHNESRTLILTDLIIALETENLPAWMRPLVWIFGWDDSDSMMPRDLRRAYRDKDALAEDVEKMISWRPWRIILAHGKWFEHNGADELDRAFRKLLRGRQWEAALKNMNEKQRHHDQ